jgi:hypothetical protein
MVNCNRLPLSLLEPRRDIDHQTRTRCCKALNEEELQGKECSHGQFTLQCKARFILAMAHRVHRTLARPSSYIACTCQIELPFARCTAARKFHFKQRYGLSNLSYLLKSCRRVVVEETAPSCGVYITAAPLLSRILRIPSHRCKEVQSAGESGIVQFLSRKG